MLYFMKLFQKLRAFFQPKSAPVPAIATVYSDEEFLNVVMEQARRRPPAGQAGRAPETEPVGPLSKAA